MVVTESVELILHFLIEETSDPERPDAILIAIGPRKMWPSRKAPETLDEALEITPAPLPFDRICGECEPKSRSTTLCDACTVEANISEMGANDWLTDIGLTLVPGDFVLRGHLTWEREALPHGHYWTAIFDVKSFEPRPPPTAGRYVEQPLDSIVGKQALLGFALPDGGEEHLWIKVVKTCKEQGAELEGVLIHPARYRADFKANDPVVLTRQEIEDLL